MQSPYSSASNREILYPKLEDNAVVSEYPAVQGMQKDVYFLNHLNKENGTEDSVSKFNMYEVMLCYSSKICCAFDDIRNRST